MKKNKKPKSERKMTPEQQEFMLQHTPDVNKLAAKFYKIFNGRVPYDDIYSEVMLSLVDSVIRFDPSRQVFEPPHKSLFYFFFSRNAYLHVKAFVAQWDKQMSGVILANDATTPSAKNTFKDGLDVISVAFCSDDISTFDKVTENDTFNRIKELCLNYDNENNLKLSSWEILDKRINQGLSFEEISRSGVKAKREWVRQIYNGVVEYIKEHWGEEAFPI